MQFSLFVISHHLQYQNCPEEESRNQAGPSNSRMVRISTLSVVCSSPTHVFSGKREWSQGVPKRQTIFSFCILWLLHEGWQKSLHCKGQNREKAVPHGGNPLYAFPPCNEALDKYLRLSHILWPGLWLLTGHAGGTEKTLGYSTLDVSLGWLLGQSL